MLKFFRKIRLELFSNGHVRKYMLYAVGEVLLVMIGILLALQVNTWNEGRKNTILANAYYCQLLEDVEQDQEQLQKLKTVAESRLSASNEAARLLQKQKALKTDVGIQMNLSIRGSYAYFIPNASAF